MIAIVPLYDVSKSFEQNCMDGPVFNGKIPARPISDRWPWKSFLGYPVASPIGVPACAIMTSKGIALMARIGFDIVTYKTIRSDGMQAYPTTNISYVAVDKDFTQADIGATFSSTNQEPEDPGQLAITNAFGNASPPAPWVFADIAAARASLAAGQVLIVSVFGCAKQDCTQEQDFVKAADIAYRAGAQVIELNLSCPNLKGAVPYKDASRVAAIVGGVVQAVPLPIIIKVGIFDSKEDMREILMTAAKAGARGIVGINSIAIKVIDEKGEPFFGHGREISGLSGAPIFEITKQFVRDAHEIIIQENLDLVLVATGGVTRHEQFQELLDAGADIALSGAGAMWYPYLAHEYHQWIKMRGPKALSYGQRAQIAGNAIAKKLFLIMDAKKTNLALAADVTTKKELLELADLVGPSICVLKTHIDIVQDFDWDLIEQLKALARKHNFLICEDRKFADIGNTLKAQYQGGIYRISQWADIIIAHALCGPDSIAALQEIGAPNKCGLLLVAQLSCTNNLITPDYEKQVQEMARQFPDFVIGFIAQSSQSNDPGLLQATPGIQFENKKDGIGQSYKSPDYAVEHLGSDIIIVGRGIYQAPDVKSAAQKYRQAAWKAYKARVQLKE